MIKKYFIHLLFFFIFLFIPFEVNAQSTYQIKYDFNFYIKESPDIDVELDVTLKNLRADLYINELSLTFPNNFNSDQLRAQTESGELLPFEINRYQVNTKVTFNFPEPEQGKNSETKFKLFYIQKDVFSNTGSVSEAILPLLTPKEGTEINATLHLPVDFENKLSLSKPIPSSIEFNLIKWTDVKAKTIVTLFGEAQNYKLRLLYGLINNESRETIQYIALPPETLYQNIIVENINPRPNDVLIDEDGNYLVGYTLNPGEEKQIVFKGYVKVFAKPQEKKFDFFRTLFSSQKKYLLSEQPFWKLDQFINQKDIKDLSSINDIYAYVVNRLAYYKNRFEDDPYRFGAKKALENPEKAVCMEFTDLFISIAREKGFYTREIQGYGYSEKQSIRPQSLTSDILHSWPEFYDQQSEIWIPVDPTWEDTSGIDYFSAFDTNHIAFAIHGKYSQSPLPAGFYKTSQKKNIYISVVSTVPKERKMITIKASFPEKLEKGKRYSLPLYITNNGNTFAYDIHIMHKTNNIEFKNDLIKIDQLAPYQSNIVYADILVPKTVEEKAEIQFLLDGNTLYEKKFTLTELKKGNTLFKSAIIIFIVIVIFIVIKSMRK